MMDGSIANSVMPILGRLEALNAVRDRALSEGRQIIRFSANTVRAVHRAELAAADAELAQARSMLESLTVSLQAFPAIYWAGYVQDAMKEFAEATLTLAIVRQSQLLGPQEIGVEDAPFLNAMAEAASELRRLILDTLRGENLELAEHYLAVMDEVYSMLISVDYPDAITGGLRRTTDQLRAVLERTRGDLTLTMNQRRLERVLQHADPTFVLPDLSSEAES
jgi:translin